VLFPLYSQQTIVAKGAKKRFCHNGWFLLKLPAICGKKEHTMLEKGSGTNYLTKGFWVEWDIFHRLNWPGKADYTSIALPSSQARQSRIQEPLIVHLFCWEGE